MIKRSITPYLKKAAKEFGVVSLTGPRQSGKTTLVKDTFPNHQYVNLENLVELNAIREDPASFINNVEGGIIIDEVQKYPELLSYIQVSIDEDFKPGKFIITGSQNLLLSEKVSQSLAGRVAVLTLFPLTIDEMQDHKILPTDYREALLKGFYPGLHDKKQDVRTYYSGYVRTYVERDVRNIKNIGDLASFERFLQLLAGRVGQLVNLTQLGNVAGVSHKTVEAWLSILEASYIIFRLQPYYDNFGKRIIKSPKIYFTDVGLLAYLLGIDSVKELQNHFALGGLFENMVVMDLYKQKLNIGSSSKVYFFRDSSGNEVDLLLDKGSEITPIEIKSSATFNTEFLGGLRYFKGLESEQFKVGNGFVVYTGDMESDFSDNSLVNWRSIGEIGV
ncbi:DUF4143 domain-containing protein [candidate division WWE3 bacterium]|nr:DUF4143 domain-containing protein [candidate division WWE3 bacterium]